MTFSTDQFALELGPAGFTLISHAMWTDEAALRPCKKCLYTLSFFTWDNTLRFRQAFADSPWGCIALLPSCWLHEWAGILKASTHVPGAIETAAVCFFVLLKGVCVCHYMMSPSEACL